MNQILTGLPSLPRHLRRRGSRAVFSSALVLLGIVGMSACGKTIDIGNSSDQASSPSATGTQGPAPSGVPSAGGDNAALQVVDTTAKDAGLNGNGGTVTGTVVQETPPKWVQMTAVAAPLSSPHLINVNQAALYRFDKDTAEPSTSNCNDACAAKWPPVTIEEGGKVYLAGVDPENVGSFRRQDGNLQITVGGWPVYRFANDVKPGDLNGQGVDNTWFAVGPTGDKVTQ